MNKTTNLPPQGSGHAHATLFDLEGMLAYLRKSYPNNVGHNVEALTGIPAATVDNWMQRRSSPQRDHLMSLIAAYGPPFLKACYAREPEWMPAALQGWRLDQINQEIAALERERCNIESCTYHGPE